MVFFMLTRTQAMCSIWKETASPSLTLAWWDDCPNADVKNCCNCFSGLVERQPQTVADVLLDWTGDDHAVNLSQLETEIESFVDAYHGVPLAELSLGQMLTDITAILREHKLGLPSDLALLIKAFISLEGMGRRIGPQFPHGNTGHTDVAQSGARKLPAAGAGTAGLENPEAHLGHGGATSP